MTTLARNAGDRVDMKMAKAFTEKIDNVVNCIPARYYLPEDVLKDVQVGNDKKTTEILKSYLQKHSKKKRKKDLHKPQLSREELNKKLEQKRQEMKEAHEKAQEVAKQKMMEKEGEKGENDGEGEERPMKKRKLNKHSKTETKQKEEDPLAAAFEKKSDEVDERPPIGLNLDVDFDVKTDVKKVSTKFEQGGSKVKRLEHAIRDEERKQKKLERLPEEEREQVEHENRVAMALRKAGGEIVKTDVAKLKRTLQGKEKLREKSISAWGDRARDVREKGVKKQANRKDNLSKKAAKKKRGSRPGFEGSLGGKLLNRDIDI